MIKPAKLALKKALGHLPYGRAANLLLPAPRLHDYWVISGPVGWGAEEWSIWA